MHHSIDFVLRTKKQSVQFIVPFPRNGPRCSTRQSGAHFRLSVYRQARLLRPSNICSVLRDISAGGFASSYEIYGSWLVFRTAEAGSILRDVLKCSPKIERLETVKSLDEFRAPFVERTKSCRNVAKKSREIYHPARFQG